MGFILFLILACGLPLAMLYPIRQRVPDDAWATFAGSSPHAAPAARDEAHRVAPAAPGAAPAAAGGGSSAARPQEVTARQGADLEHGLSSNAVRVEGTDRRQDGTIPVTGETRDGGSQAV
ncbi:hypothetical protein [Methylobacterium sp. JK268]